jgi:hypothetical protein
MNQHSHNDPMAIANEPDRHAFVMLGTENLFLCHLTMFHMENHCYQVVLQVTLPEPEMGNYKEQRSRYSGETLFLGNVKQDLWTIPEVQTGRRKNFIADIWKGIPNKKKYDSWPWDGPPPDPPVIQNVPVNIDRVVYYRHFDFNLMYPTTLTYLLFGAGNEAFLTHYQVKEPDFDQVVTLAKAPTWLPDEQLRAGVPINILGLSGGLQCESPLRNDGTYSIQYAGFPGNGALLAIDVLHTDWFCTKIVNTNNPCPDP